MREAFARIGLVALGILVGVVLFDLALRRALDVYRCDERLGWTFVPGRTALWTSRTREFWNVVRFNALGFYDPEREVPKPPATYRILLLGDSFVASLQVPREESFAGRIEDVLARDAAPGRRIEVVNAGVNGYGTAQQLLLLRDVVGRLEPDLVLLGVFAANDVADNAVAAGSTSHQLAARCGRPFFDPAADELRLLDARRTPDGGLLRRFLLRHSALFSIWDPSREPDGPPPAFEAGAIYAGDPTPALEEAWGLTEALLRAARDELVARGIPFGVLALPGKAEIGLVSTRERSRALDYARPRRRLVAFLAHERIPVLDLWPPLARHVAQDRPLPFYIQDTHWTPEGHAVVADALLTWLRAHRYAFRLPLAANDGHTTRPSSSPAGPEGA
jgi:lysophospholipase L1-like esterase